MEGWVVARLFLFLFFLCFFFSSFFFLFGSRFFSPVSYFVEAAIAIGFIGIPGIVIELV